MQQLAKLPKPQHVHRKTANMVLQNTNHTFPLDSMSMQATSVVTNWSDNTYSGVIRLNSFSLNVRMNHDYGTTVIVGVAENLYTSLLFQFWPGDRYTCTWQDG